MLSGLKLPALRSAGVGSAGSEFAGMFLWAPPRTLSELYLLHLFLACSPPLSLVGSDRKNLAVAIHRYVLRN